MDEMRGQFFFDDTEDLSAGPEPLPLGEFTFEVIAVKPGTAKTGRGRLGVQVQIHEGPQAGKKGWDNWNLPADSDKRDGRIYKFWKRIAQACPGAIMTDGSGQKLVPEALVGLLYKGTVAREEYEGREMTRINFPYPVAMKGGARPTANEGFKIPN